jgi:cysteine desulfurase/selenocysteine lyase
MPTRSESNGSGPLDPDPRSRSEASPEAESVTKGGPFDLGEMQRLANELFRALPGALLPGIDPDQLDSVALPAAAESLRAPAVPLPTPNGHLTSDPATMRDLSGAVSAVTGPAREATAGAAPQRWSYLPDVARAEPPGPGALPPSTGAGLLELTGDPIQLSELGLADVPSGALQDPFAGSYYFLEDAGRLTRAPQATETPQTTETPQATRIPAATGIPGIPGIPGDTGAPGAVAGQSVAGLVARESAHPAFDVYALRGDFPVLGERVHGRPLVWLDNGATTQKPEAVIERLDHFYRHENSNIHRGAHELAARATDAYEDAREQTARFLHAASSDEIVFVRGTTEAINLVAQAWGRANVGPGDEILITWLEHHANIVPWQQLCQATGATLRVAPVNDSGQVMLDEYQRLLSDRTRIVAFSHVSNALGTITPARELTELAHRYGARVLIDGAQAVAHMPVDVQLLDSDWYAFSGHKVFAPTGIGVLHGKLDLLNSMAPWQGGGNMIRDVTFQQTLYQPAPQRFEAGTTSIADAVGLGAALAYLQQIGMHNIARHEHDLLAYTTAALTNIPGLQLIGTAPEKAAVLSFLLDGFTPEQIGDALNHEGIAVRAGHHCAQPIIRRFGHEGTVRASLAFYNTHEDIDALTTALHTIATHSTQPPNTNNHRYNGAAT